MRHGLYELKILGNDKAVLPERCIDGRVDVEARPGEEFRIRISIHKSIKPCLAKFYANGEYVGQYGFPTLDASVADRFNYTAVYFPNGLPNNYKILEFVTAPTTSNFKEEDESATGEVMVEFYETEGSLGTYPHSFVPETPPKSENNKPYKQPSLMIQPGRAINCVAPLPQNWMVLRDVPDAVLRIKCHTKSTIDFLQFRHDQDQLATRNANTMDITDDSKEEEAPMLARDTTSTSATSATSSTRAGIPSATAFDFAMPAASSAAGASGKPVLRLKNRANKTTKARVEAAAVHAAGTKRKANE